MTDLSKLTNAELMRLRNQAPAAPDLSSIPTEQLLAMREDPSAMVRLGRGFEDVRQGVKQIGTAIGEKAASMAMGESEVNPATSVQPEQNRQATEDLKLYERGQGGGMDWMRIAGNILGTLPTMAVGGGTTMLARTAVGAGQGAAASAAIFTPDQESKLKQTLIGAGFGATMPVVMRGLASVASRGVEAVKSFLVDPARNPQLAQSLVQDLTTALQSHGIDFGQLAQQTKDALLQDAVNALKAGGKLDPEQLARKADITAVGGQPTRASVTRSPEDWRLEQNMRGLDNGIGAPIARRAQENAQAMMEYLGQMRTSTGGKAGTALEAGESAIGALKAGDAAKEKAVDDLYKAWRASGVQDTNVPATKLADTLGKVSDEIGTENIPAAVLNRLKEFGLVGGNQTKVLTVNEADKLNRLINNNNPGNGPASLALGRIKSALNEAMLEIEPAAQSGVEALKAARAAAAQRFREQEASKGITAAVDDIAPDRFVRKYILNAEARDLAATKAELLKTAEGRQAFNDIRGHLFDDLLMKATGSSSMSDLATKIGSPEGRFSGAAFAKALDAIAPEKMRLIFSPEEIGQLRTLQRASKFLTTEVPFAHVNYSNTSSAIANLLMKIPSAIGGAFTHIPVLGTMAAGAYKVGTDAIKDQAARRAVAESLVGGVPLKLPQSSGPNLIERAVPGAAGAAYAQPRDSQ